MSDLRQEFDELIKKREKAVTLREVNLNRKKELLAKLKENGVNLKDIEASIAQKTKNLKELREKIQKKLDEANDKINSI